MKISATVITFNEEKNLKRLLDSLDFVDEIIIADSFSTDSTAQIAKSYEKVKFFEQEFLGYGEQKNFAASKASNNWILSVDADEEISRELKESILKAITSESAEVYEINRLTFFADNPIKHGGWFPDWLPRLYLKDKAKFDNPPVHESLIYQGSAKRIDGLINHYSFSGVEDQLRTNLKYASEGALKLKSSTLLHVFIRPIFKFLECYVWKLGFLDGKAGLFIAINAAYSIYMKYSIRYWQDR